MAKVRRKPAKATRTSKPARLASPNKDILVVGDVVEDHHIYEGNGLGESTPGHRAVRITRQVGGAFGLNGLLKAVIGRLKTEVDDLQKLLAKAQKVLKKAVRAGAANSIDVAEKNVRDFENRISASVGQLGWSTAFGLKVVPDRMHRAFAVWTPFPKQVPEKEQFWRVDLMMGQCPPEPLPTKPGDPPESDLLKPIPHPAPRVLVLDDGGFKFRNAASNACWHLPKPDEPTQWIVLKLTGDVCDGDLWNHLCEKNRYQEKLTLIVSAHALRQQRIQLSAGLSWEQTIEDLRRTFDTDPDLKKLKTAARHLIVTFSSDGAVWFDNEPGKSRATLVFDASGIEGKWARDVPGEAFGYLSCMTAAVVCGIMRQPDQLNLAPAIGSGLAAMRDLRQTGHGLLGDALPDGFPYDRVAAVVAKPAAEFSQVPIPESDREWAPYAVFPKFDPKLSPWRIIESSQVPFGVRRTKSVTGMLAVQFVLQGESVISRLPHAKFGKLTAVDRREIEAFRNLERLMLGHKSDPKPKRPLSVGVFGPPGAGKSFGVKEIAKSIFGEKAWLEFNLSQFAGVTDFIGALHQVRDLVLAGETPVVFWDEFDSRDYFWLQYLLAPMQDGKFQEGPINHSVGKCVFVFAGGTSYSFAEFGPKEPADVKPHEAWDKFKLLKGPDFRSRLDAFLDVLGPNQMTRVNPANLEREADPKDELYRLRRGVFVRNKLEENGLGKKARADIDLKLLAALLNYEKFTFGSRSLEKLVSSVTPAGPDGPVRRSGLPPPSVLAMHLVDYRPGITIFDTMDTDGDNFQTSQMIDHIAKAIHESYLPFAKPDSPYAKSWAELKPNEKADNIAAARRIPDVLALAGLRLVAADGAKTEKAVKDHIDRHIERLAEAEHEGWMAQRVRGGWKFGDSRDDDKKLHPLMKPYAELPEVEKDKDRRSVKNYAGQVESAKYRIVFE